MIRELDDLQTKLGGASTLHYLSCLAAFIAGFGPGFSTQFAVFSSAVPDFRQAQLFQPLKLNTSKIM